MFNRLANSKAIKAQLHMYAQPDSAKACWQLANTLLPYWALWGFLLTCPPAWVPWAIPLASLLLLRVFVLQHDCGHGSFFPSGKWNDRVGNFLGIFTLTPLYNWRLLHNLHHATSGNLDRRGMGDLWLMTCQEYASCGKGKQFLYRVYRHPLTLFLFCPGLYFVLRRRFPIALSPRQTLARRNVYQTNLAISALFAVLVFLFGFWRFTLVSLPIFFLTSSMGVWLFYVQHQFDDAYWERASDWDPVSAGILGSSYYDLPAWLHWFTADIAVHHIHHVDSRIPNYHLRRCMQSSPELLPRVSIRFWQSLRLGRLALWDENEGKLVGFAK